MHPIVYVFVYLFEMLIVYLFFSKISEKRYPIGSCLGIGIVLFGLSALQNIALNHSNVLINISVTAIVIFTFSSICFSIKPLTAGCYSAILTVLNLASELIVVFFISSFTNTQTEDLYNNPVLFLMEIPATKLLFFLSCHVLSGLATKNANQSKVPLSFIAYPLTLCLCLIAFWYICAMPNVREEIRVILAVVSFVLFAVTVYLYITYQHEIKKNNELLLMKNEIERQKTEKVYYDILEQQNQQLMIYAHDTKKHLAAIQRLNTDPQINSYVEALSGELQQYCRHCHSGNKLLDIIISKYTIECEQKGVTFNCDVKTCNLKQVEDIDLVAILGNIMDNALSSAAHSKGKYLSLDTTFRNGYSVIIVSNSCDNPPVTRGNQLLSTKTDAGFHGYGLKSVKRSLSKYSGDFSWDYNSDNNEFTITIMIQE